MDTIRKRRWWAALPLLAGLLAAACDDPAAPEAEGRVSAVLTDNPGASMASSEASPAEEPAAASSFQGQMSGTAQVHLYSEAHGWVAVGSPTSASMTLQSSGDALVQGQASVPAGSYTRVRLVLEGAAADIAAGADLGGLVLGASVRITLGGTDARVEIEKEVPSFTVSASSTATVRFDMNSQAWVNQASAEAETATDAEIQAATTAEVTSS